MHYERCRVKSRGHFPVRAEVYWQSCKERKGGWARTDEHQQLGIRAGRRRPQHGFTRRPPLGHSGDSPFPGPAGPRPSLSSARPTPGPACPASAGSPRNTAPPSPGPTRLCTSKPPHSASFESFQCFPLPLCKMGVILSCQDP